MNKAKKTQAELAHPYPGTPMAADGSEGVVWVEIHISQAACAFPITPSSNMDVLHAQAVAGDLSALLSRRAVNSRAFPLLIYDPRKGESMRERLSLRGNPAVTEDWMPERKSGQPYTFVDFARAEGRFAKHFDSKGEASPEPCAASDDRRRNWRLLRELAGVGEKN